MTGSSGCLKLIEGLEGQNNKASRLLLGVRGTSASAVSIQSTEYSKLLTGFR